MDLDTQYTHVYVCMYVVCVHVPHVLCVTYIHVHVRLDPFKNLYRVVNTFVHTVQYCTYTHEVTYYEVTVPLASINLPLYCMLVHVYLNPQQYNFYFQS